MPQPRREHAPPATPPRTGRRRRMHAERADQPLPQRRGVHGREPVVGRPRGDEVSGRVGAADGRAARELLGAERARGRAARPLEAPRQRGAHEADRICSGTPLTSRELHTC